MARYALIRKMDISNGEGIGISLFMQGCHFHCKNCFNPETWDFNGGKEWNEEVKKHFLKLASNEHVNRISILGGEPLCSENIKEIIDLCKNIKSLYPNKRIWLYSGYTYEEIRRDIHKAEILLHIDILVDGLYKDELQDFKLYYRGSSNQRVIDVQKSNALSINEVVTLYESL